MPGKKMNCFLMAAEMIIELSKESAHLNIDTKII
jgi:hypothetical protein